jgi:hypothetical protein
MQWNVCLHSCIDNRISLLHMSSATKVGDGSKNIGQARNVGTMWRLHKAKWGCGVVSTLGVVVETHKGTRF